MSKLRLGLSTVFMLILLGIFSAVAFADTPAPTNPAPGINVANVDNFGNPSTQRTHGNFQNNTNSCANCHSVHNGETSTLLMKGGSDYDLCMTCHDGTMGFYNVNQASNAGVFNSTHLSASMHQVSSNVLVNAAPDSYSNGADPTQSLSCTSCHNPHGSINDRLLNENILMKSGVTQPFAYTTDINGAKVAAIPNGTKLISISETPDPNYQALNDSTGATGLKIMVSNGPADSTSKTYYAQFCGACHNDIVSSRSKSVLVKPSNQAKTLAGDTTHYTYTHTTNSTSQGRNCYSCHYAHGTDVTLMMDTLGKKVSDYVAQGWSEDKAEAYMQDVNPGGSKLKKFTNMVVCWTCHQKNNHPIASNPVDPQFLDATGKFLGVSQIK